MSDNERVVIFDTTLRDGEQSPGISLDVGEKLEIAEQLARLGVDYMEAGFPVASQGDFEAVEAIARSVKGPVITGLSRTALKDVDRCWEAVQDAEQGPDPRVHRHVREPHEEQAEDDPGPGEDRGRLGGRATPGPTPTTSSSPPRTRSRSDFDFMCEVLQIAVDAGATTLNIPDTVGFAIPQEYGQRFRSIRERVTGDYVLSAHCHDDLGMAVANSLAAVEAGARQVEVAVNGIGERAGNAALEEIVMALRTRSAYFGGLDTTVRAEELAKTSRLVSRLTGYPVQYNKAVVGRNAFAHEAGIHQHGMLEDRTTYEIMDPNAVGQDTSLVLGKHSGRHAFSDTLEKMGLKVQGDALNQAFARFKELADRKVEITDADLEAIVAAELNVAASDAFELSSIEFRGSNVGPASAQVVLVRTADGEKVEATAEGDGMIDAAGQAIRAATGIDGRQTDFNVSSVTGGVDALGDVVIQFESEGSKVSGRGVSTDVVEASARAFLNAINKIVRIRDRADVRDIETGP